MAEEEGFEAEVVEIVGRTGMTGEATAAIPGAAEPAGGALLPVEAAKGKAIPADVIDLIDHRLGPGLARADAERQFASFADSETLKIQITPWYRKKHGGKHVEKIE